LIAALGFLVRAESAYRWGILGCTIFLRRPRGAIRLSPLMISMRQRDLMPFAFGALVAPAKTASPARQVPEGRTAFGHPILHFILRCRSNERQRRLKRRGDCPAEPHPDKKP
jgi:hypothetical protein